MNPQGHLKPFPQIVPTPESFDLPVIQCIEGELLNIILQAMEALIKSGEPIYQRDKVLLRPVKWTKTLKPSYARRPEGLLTLVAIEKPWLIATLTSVADFRKFDKRQHEWRRINCPTPVADGLLSLFGQWKFPHLEGILQAPFVRPDGSIRDSCGFDEETGILVDFEGTWPSISIKPSLEDAQLALEMLRQPFKEFPFFSKADESVTLSAVLTALHGPTLPTKPIFMISATAPGSGKSLLCDVVSTIVTGRAPSVMSWGSTDEESEKRLSAMLFAGDPIIMIDNIERPFGSEMLCSFCTQESLSIRILGQSRIIKVGTVSTIFGTGNNAQPKGDMIRRVLQAQLDPGCERPELRKFDWSPLEYARQHRQQLVNAAITILKAFINVGTPKIDLVPFGSFDDWSRLIRSALVWAGATDPCLVMERTRTKDPEIERLTELLRIWQGAFRNLPTAVREAINPIPPNSEMLSIVDNICGRNDPNRALGNYLSKVEGRVVLNKRFIRAGSKNGSTLWMVEDVSDAKELSGLTRSH